MSNKSGCDECTSHIVYLPPSLREKILEKQEELRLRWKRRPTIPHTIMRVLKDWAGMPE